MLPFTSKGFSNINRMFPILITNLNRTHYADAWSLQQKLWTHRRADVIEDIILLTEHEHVYTLGKSSNDNHLLASDEELTLAGIEVFHTDRGGDITYHGPGQIVGYPILDLNNYFCDIHRYMRSLEEVIIRALSHFGVMGVREEGMTGVWVDGEKIAALGVKVSHWITMHGFALNVNTDLTKYNRIIPCGIFHKGVTSMQKVLGQNIDMELICRELIDCFCEVFKCQQSWKSKEELDLQMKINSNLLRDNELISQNLLHRESSK
jgi:lipoyl(octanoyl) transferase